MDAQKRNLGVRSASLAVVDYEVKRRDFAPLLASAACLCRASRALSLLGTRSKGSINVQDFTKGAVMLGLVGLIDTGDICAAIFAEIDVDGKGRISEEQFTIWALGRKFSTKRFRAVPALQKQTASFSKALSPELQKRKSIFISAHSRDPELMKNMAENIAAEEDDVFDPNASYGSYTGDESPVKGMDEESVASNPSPAKGAAVELTNFASGEKKLLEFSAEEKTGESGGLGGGEEAQQGGDERPYTPPDDAALVNWGRLKSGRPKMSAATLLRAAAKAKPPSSASDAATANQDDGNKDPTVAEESSAEATASPPEQSDNLTSTTATVNADADAGEANVERVGSAEAAEDDYIAETWEQ